MSEVLVRFTEKIRGPNAGEYAAQACGGIADDGLWEGWIEFAAPGRLLRTPRETEQPNRGALVYWAEGLSAAYLEGALNRALPSNVVQPIPEVSEPSMFANPARPEHTAPYVRAHSVLDPFATYMQGEGILRQQLAALSRDHLLTLIEAHQLDVVDGEDVLKAELIDHIVRAVKRYSRSA